MLEGVLLEVGKQMVFLTFLLPVGILWAVTLLAIIMLTLRELWLGRRRKKHHRKEFKS